ncbi:MAG: class II aldolase/adducin family protein [Verrucomicrobiae bacterium]|nr:class II aldolase/adducin family protein [Verrucomicrobiae bacterium]
MKTLLSVRDIERLARQGGGQVTLPDGALLTPSAKDRLNEIQAGGVARGAPAPGASAGTPKGASALETLFHSLEVQAFKEQICDIGRRLWAREYVDGNGGNLSIRINENVVLCTPTLVSKGFMKPEDLCFVDMEGRQLAGVKRRTSEILMHLQIMKRQPKAKAVVHCHPPHATAFAIAGVTPPTCMIPEIEVFVGKVPIAPYRTPGTPEMGKLVADLTEQHNTILMANHGVVSWSHLGVEDSYFKMEIVEAYCRTVLAAAQLGTDLKTFSGEQLGDLLRIKQKLGIPDPRLGLKECELCDNSDWRPGVTCVTPSEAVAPSADPEIEKIVQSITDQILIRLAGKS